MVGIKGVGLAAIESIVKEREESGPFTSFEDFISRADIKVLNKRLIENLIYAGACGIIPHRSATATALRSVVDRGCIVA